LNLLARVAGAVLGVLLFVAAFIFASVIFAVVAVIALMIWAWLWWRTRHLPRRGAGGHAPGAAGTVIEGEYRVEREVRRLDEPPR
jgi:membrane protein implicated in regulation of membrane protease activity